MSELLLNLSNSHLFWQGRDPEPIEAHHRPHFLAFPRGDEPVADAHERLSRLVAEAKDLSPDEDDLAKVFEVGEPESYGSFWDHGRKREVVPVVAKRSYWVPEISDELFFEHGFYTAEHDIPYMDRAGADLAADKDWWLFDTKGKKAKLSVLTYDIETTQYEEGKRDIPIDVIGWSDFPVEYEAQKDLETEKFDFRFHHMPTDWAEREVEQLVARNVDEELDNLEAFTRKAVQHDMVAGHNVLGFDNLQIHDRIKYFLGQNRKQQNMSASMEDWFRTFTEVYSRRDRSFHFGTQSDIAVWHPSTLDTFHAARKFYFFYDDFTLKGLAPWLGVHVEDRVYMEPDTMKLDDATLQYNKHDVQEQLGITQMLLAQALPLAFTVGMPLENLLTGGNTKMWDHMALIRARRERRIMPATSRAQAVCRAIHRHLPHTPYPERQEVAESALAIGRSEAASSANKEFVRVAKQGPEMPFWCEHPAVIANPHREGDPTGYAIAGGLTLKPDADLQSHFVPWYHVVEADVGAMYPTILKARNLTADTVQPARKGEPVDDWLWLMRLDQDFVDSGRYEVRRPDPETESFTKGRGYMIGVKHDKEDGMVNRAMTGILDTIQKVKDERAKAKAAGAPADQVRIHDMTYASLKAARNAGTHGIMVAVNVSCRQFNVWGGANITTIGQEILHGTRQDFEERGIRVVYGDTDGIYLGCSKSAGNLPHLAAAIGADVEPQEDKWITMPDDAVKAVADANAHWQKLLDYPGFELEAEQYDCMVYVVHKNYLKFSTQDGKLKMETKGNNFKGSDKAPLARSLLGEAMAEALRDVAEWDDEEDARERMKTAIKRGTKHVMLDRDLSETPWAELTLRQSVRPIRAYKPNPDGSASNFAVRTAALEHLLGEPITAGRKFRFIVCKDPLPLYQDAEAQKWAKDRIQGLGAAFVLKKPRKSGIKPIEYMWPVERVEPHMVDWPWYTQMVEEYVKGAFGFDSLELATQRDLSSWF